MTVAIVRGDARALPLPDESVDLIVTSPPYWGHRSYTDDGEHYTGQIGSEATPGEYIAALLDCTREWMRVLKPAGSIFVNLGDKYGRGTRTTIHGSNSKQAYADGDQPGVCAPTGYEKSLFGLPWRYAIGCIDQLSLILRAEVIWDKPNGLPESVTDRVRRSHEQLFHFTKQPRYYAAVDEIREAYRPVTVRALGALPGSVWSIPSQPLIVPAHLGVDHFAAFPMELPRRIILGWSPSGAVVLDPLGGTGTTALVATVLGRSGITVDMSGDYCRLARWRTTDPGERARAMGVKKPPPVPHGQGSLFDEEMMAWLPTRTWRRSSTPTWHWTGRGNRSACRSSMSGSRARGARRCWAGKTWPPRQGSSAPSRWA